MTALGPRRIAAFPFVDPPDARARERRRRAAAGARRARRHAQLSPIGRRLATLPVDPRLGRMVARGRPQRLPARGARDRRRAVGAGPARAARRTAPGRRREARPLRRRRLGLPGLPQPVAARRRAREALSRQPVPQGAARRVPATSCASANGRTCTRQLRQAARNAGLTPNDADASPDKIHARVLSGLLSQVGLREGETREYLGARGAHFMIFPGSPLAKKSPRWVMAAELVETSRLFARTVAKIQPEWIEPLAGHLVKRTYSEPHWSTQARGRRRGRTGDAARRADRGRPPRRLRPDRPRDLPRPVHPPRPRRGRLGHPPPLLPRQPARCWRTSRSWRRGRGGATCPSTRRRCSRSTTRASPPTSSPGGTSTPGGRSSATSGVLDFTEEMVRTAQAAAIDPSAYPDHVEAGGLTLPLSYAFEPGRRDDGITVDVPVAALQAGGPDPVHVAGAGAARGAGHGADQDPAQDPAAPVRARARPRPRRARPAERRRRAAPRRAGARAGPDARRHDPARRLGARPAARAPHRHVPGGGRAAARRSRAAPTWRRCAASSPRRSRRSWPPPTSRSSGLTTWTIGELPHEIGVRRGRHVVTGYPGLVDRGDSVDVRVFPTAAERDAAHARGVRRLLLLDTPSPARQVQRDLDSATRLVLARNPLRLGRRARRGLRDGRRRRADRCRGRAGVGRARIRPAKRALLAKRLAGTTQQVLEAARGVLAVWHRVQSALADLRAAPPDLTAQLDGLVGPGFASRNGATRLADVARYLEAPPSGGSRSCASTRPATRRGRRRSPSSPTSTRSSWPRSARRRAVARAARDPLDDRGAAREPLRAPDAHPLPGVGPAHPAGHRRPVTGLIGESPGSATPCATRRRESGLGVMGNGDSPSGVGVTWILRPDPGAELLERLRVVVERRAVADHHVGSSTPVGEQLRRPARSCAARPSSR